ncbi:MAG: hypothetical protein R2873_33055 [Caldilineaceae bacterium]
MADVVRSYEGMLGRAPESRRIIEHQIKTSETVTHLIRNLAHSQEFARILGRDMGQQDSPFNHYHASVDVRGIIESHINDDRKPKAEHHVNFLGVAVPVKVMDILKDVGGQMDVVPIPANYHADMAEWAAALRSVDLASETYTMIELGCGWGCWMNNMGTAAKARGLSIHVIGIEGDERHIEFAQETLQTNHISTQEYTLIRGIAASRSGYALFPRSKGDEWGSEPIFDVSETESAKAVAGGKYDRLRMVPLEEAIGDRAKIDLLHIDIQGGEAALIEEAIQLITEKIGYLTIGTHSRAIEGRLFDALLTAGWILEIERPAVLRIIDGKPVTLVDGVQGWRNPQIHGYYTA